MTTAGFRRATVLVTVAAVVVRLAVVVATNGSFRLTGDGVDYQRLAQSLLHGRGFGVSHFAPGGGPTALRPPGFPVWLAAVEGAFRGHVLAGRLADAIAGAAVVPLVVVLARRMGTSRVGALCAGAVCAVLPQLVLASASLMSEAVFVPLSLGTVVAMVEFRRSGPGRWLIVSGLLLGLAVVTRPVAVVLVVPLVVLALPWRRVRAQLPAMLAALALAVAPALAWEVRTVHELHRVVPLTTQGGFLLAGTYNATSAGNRDQPGVWLPPPLDPAMQRILAAHPHADEAQTNDLLQSAATRYLGHHPRYPGTVMVHNTMRVLDLTDPSFERQVNENEFGMFGGLVVTEQIGALLLLFAAACGVARGGLRRWPVAVWLAPLLLLAVTVPVQSFTRFRAPVDPYLAVLAVSPVFRRPVSPAQATRGQPVATDRPVRALDALTSMRFLAALVVVLLHSALLLGPTLPHASGYARLVFAGPTGVGFFFVLSGFVLAWSARRDDTRPAFYRRRVARIVPLYILCWVVTVLLYVAIAVPVHAGPALTSLFLVHAWVPLQRYFGAVDTPGWSLSCELFFYALFPLLLPRLLRLSRRGMAAVAGVALVVPVLAAVATPVVAGGLPSSSAHWLVIDAPPVRLAEFVLGMLLALAVRRGELRRVPVWPAALGCVAAFAVVDLVHTQRLMVVVTLVPFVALIGSLAQAELAGGLDWLRRRTPVRLGQWSFALYLVHWPVLVLAAHLHPQHFGSTVAGYGAVAVVVAMAVGASGLLFTFVERPLERRIRPRHDLPVALRPAPASPEWATS